MSQDLTPCWLTSLLPTVENREPLRLSHFDAVIHAPGFEDRTMAVAESVTSSVGSRAILLDYLPYNPKNRLHDVREALSSAGIRVTDKDIVKYDRFGPDNFEERLQERLIHRTISRVFIDISTMSKLAIILVLKVCERLQLEVQILYTEAEMYGPTEEEFLEAKERNEIHRPSLQVFTGVHGVVRVDSLASVAMQGQPTAAVVFMSFNDALTQVLLNSVYPSRLFLINSRPPQHGWREAATAWIHDQVRREWDSDNPVDFKDDLQLPTRTVSTLDYRQTVTALIELYWNLSARHRLLLAPAGSKMQAIGCYLVKALHPDIHIEYPSPEGFAPGYSERQGSGWIVKLGKITDLLSQIAEQERRFHLEIPS